MKMRDREPIADAMEGTFRVPVSSSDAQDAEAFALQSAVRISDRPGL